MPKALGRLVVRVSFPLLCTPLFYDLCRMSGGVTALQCYKVLAAPPPDLSSQRLAELLVARRCCCHPPVFRPDPPANCHVTPRGGPRAARTALADVLPVSAASGGEIGSPASRSPHNTPHSPPPIALCCLLRCSAASQPRRPAPRRLPWRRLCDCVCVYCVWGNAGNAGDAGTRGVHLTSRVQEVQSPPSAGSRRCCIPRARACRAPLEASRRAR